MNYKCASKTINCFGIVDRVGDLERVTRISAQASAGARSAITPTPHVAPLFVAKDKRFYEKYGLDVQLILVISGSLVAQIFQAGAIPIAANAPASLISLAATGEKMSFFLGLSNTTRFSVVTSGRA